MYQLTNTAAILRLSDGACIPADPLNMDYAAFLEWVAQGNEPLPYEAPQPTLAALRAGAIQRVQSLLDAQAQAWGYDSIFTAITYLGDPNPAFAAEALALRDWRSATWTATWANEGAPNLDALLAALPPPPDRPSP